jgi:F-box/WD-40 domain protein MET30
MSDLAGPSSLKRPATEESPNLKRRRVDSSPRLKQRKSEVSSDSDACPATDEQGERNSSVEVQERKNKKPWKHVYCERLIVERNWRKGRYTERTLKVSRSRR